jgi:hypothetical protein
MAHPLPDAFQEAEHLEKLSATNNGGEAYKELLELRHTNNTEYNAVISKMTQDASQEGGRCVIDDKNQQLIFSSPFNEARRVGY